MYLVLSEFTSSPISFLQTTKASVFFFIICTLLPSILTYQFKPDVDMYHLILSPLGLPELSLWHMLNAKLKSSGDKASSSDYS